MNKEIKKYEEINKKIDNKNKELKEIEEKYKTFLRGLNFGNYKNNLNIQYRKGVLHI